MINGKLRKFFTLLFENKQRLSYNYWNHMIVWHLRRFELESYKCAWQFDYCDLHKILCIEMLEHTVPVAPFFLNSLLSMVLPLTPWFVYACQITLQLMGNIPEQGTSVKYFIMQQKISTQSHYVVTRWPFEQPLNKKKIEHSAVWTHARYLHKHNVTHLVSAGNL